LNYGLLWWKLAISRKRGKIFRSSEYRTKRCEPEQYFRH
jgi:hypothetical protein